MRRRSDLRLTFGAVIAFIAAPAIAAGPAPAGLDRMLAKLERERQFSGAVVIRDTTGVRFARGYGMADPFTGRAFLPDTKVDSGSLAKPVTAAVVLSLASEGRIDLDAPARRYLQDLPDGITVRHLLAHSAGLAFDGSEANLVGKSNAELIRQGARGALLFRPGTAFDYCNLCTIALAEIVERRTGVDLIDFARRRLFFPASVRWRPARLLDWKGRAIGFRLGTDQAPRRADSYDGELFTGAANLSISASELADWGARWAGGAVRGLAPLAIAPARIGAAGSGLSWGNWYCSPNRSRCHYLGHHEGFHHMLYWDSRRKLAVAMVSNNSLRPALQQRLQRAIVAAAEGRSKQGRLELQRVLNGADVVPGSYRVGGEPMDIRRDGERWSIERRGIRYPAYPSDAGVRYVPGLDAYLSLERSGRMRFLTLYEDLAGARVSR